MPKKIIINENQEKLLGIKLQEAALDSFSLQELSNISSFRGRVQYCRQMLGFPIGNGSSRITFQIDDEKVLKLAKNEKGIAQNETEWDPLASQNYGMIPKLFECDENYNWIIVEYVLPAKKADFQECLGVSFDTYLKFVITVYNQYARRKPYYATLSDEEYDYLYENNQWFQDLYYYMADYQLPYGDLIRIANLGMCMRNGEPTIVILDSGLNDDVWNRYYKR